MLTFEYLALATRLQAVKPDLVCATDEVLHTVVG